MGSTSGIIDYATASNHREFIIGTEDGVMYELRTKNPDKIFYPAMENAYCLNMKKVSLQKVYDCLNEEKNEVFVSDEIRLKSIKVLDRMLELAR